MTAHAPTRTVLHDHKKDQKTMFTAAQLVAHLVGDYVIQSDYEAAEKRKRSLPAAVHAVSYAIPFLLLTHAQGPLAFIVITHFIIDRWGLARYVCWAKNFIGSPWTWEQFRSFLGWRPGVPFPLDVWTVYRRPWSECVGTGYPADRPPFLAVWLMILCDNCIHICLNAVALEWIR